VPGSGVSRCLAPYEVLPIWLEPGTVLLPLPPLPYWNTSSSTQAFRSIPRTGKAATLGQDACRKTFFEIPR